MCGHDLIAPPCTKMNFQIRLEWILDFLTLGGEMIDSWKLCVMLIMNYLDPRWNKYVNLKFKGKFSCIMLQISCQMNALTLWYNSAANAPMWSPWRTEFMIRRKRNRSIDSKYKIPWRRKEQMINMVMIITWNNEKWRDLDNLCLVGIDIK